jgi:hypothetical protein
MRNVAPIKHDKLIGEAKCNLTLERIAFPPYEGVTFVVEVPEN